MIRLFVTFLLFFLIIPQVNAEAPRSSLKYKRDLIRHSRIVWGLNAPIPLFASQIHQESSWNHLAKSKYAEGLSQFTRSTADWIVDVYPELKRANVYNPKWSMRAMLLYDNWLYERILSENECEQWAMVLSSYNGGLTWLNRDKKLTKSRGGNPQKWWNNVENFSQRADWAIIENRNYARKIIYEHQSIYGDWGRYYICEENQEIK